MRSMRARWMRRALLVRRVRLMWRARALRAQRRKSGSATFASIRAALTTWRTTRLFARAHVRTRGATRRPSCARVRESTGRAF